MNIGQILKPETEFEKQIITIEEFRKGCLYGKPRSGHPEGKVIAHIRDVLDNVDNLRDQTNREKLRMVSFVHDTFKYKVNKDIPRAGENHHGMLARRFIEKYTQDKDILEITELHDEAYNSWRAFEEGFDSSNGVARAEKLITRLDKRLGLYLAFYACDNSVEGKSPIHRLWFSTIAKSYL